MRLQSDVSMVEPLSGVKIKYRLNAKSPTQDLVDFCIKTLKFYFFHKCFIICYFEHRNFQCFSNFSEQLGYLIFIGLFWRVCD